MHEHHGVIRGLNVGPEWMERRVRNGLDGCKTLQLVQAVRSKLTVGRNEKG